MKENKTKVYHFDSFLDERKLNARFEQYIKLDDVSEIYEDENPLQVAFDWNETKEGYLFWEDVQYDWERLKEIFKTNGQFSITPNDALKLKIIVDVINEIDDVPFDVANAVNELYGVETISSEKKLKARDIKSMFFGKFY